jgi:hypothetical protein
MKARLGVLALIVIGAMVLAFTLTTPAVGLGSIIVNSADSVRTEVITSSQSLASTFSIVQPRVILQYANTMRPFSLTVPPSGLQTLFGQVTARIVFQYANTNRAFQLAAAPSALQTLFGQVTPRIIFQYANTNRAFGLSVPPAPLQTLFGQVSARIVFQYANSNRAKSFVYPVALISDTSPPQFTNISASTAGIGVVRVSWTTDEWADTTLRYGAQAGSYTTTNTDALYYKSHSVTLTGLTTGATYYFQTQGTDRSGNTAVSAESNFKVRVALYLPFIKR